MLNTILFDLDGTLCPFVREDFMRATLSALVHFLTPMGYNGEKVTAALTDGIQAMQASDGSMTNRQVFWDSMTRSLGVTALSLEPMLADFYQGDFQAVRGILRKKLDHGSLLRELRSKGYALALATNPLLPTEAVETELSWVGLQSRDFDFLTTYENSRHCKPQAAYFEDVLATLVTAPQDCLMVGDSLTEDMAAARLGFSGFLVTDFSTDLGEDVPASVTLGTMEEATAYLHSLPPINC